MRRYQMLSQYLTVKMWDNPLLYMRIKISQSPIGRVTAYSIIHKRSNQNDLERVYTGRL